MQNIDVFETVNLILNLAGMSNDDYFKAIGFEQLDHDTGLLSEIECCKWLSISKVHLYKLVREGEIPRVTLGKKTRRYLLSDLQNYVKNHKEIGM